MKKLLWIGLMGTVVLFSGFKLGIGDEKLILKVGDSKITAQDIEDKLAAMPAQYKEYYSTPEGKRQLIENLKKELLILELSKKEKYDTNKDVLEQMTKVRNQVMVAIYLRDKIEKTISVSDGDAKKYYTEHKDEFKTKDQVKARHILVKTEEEAKQLISKLDKGANFGDLAAENSLDPSGKSSKGDLGWFAHGQMVKPFEAAAFALAKGSYTKSPVQTQFGWHVILVEDKKAEQDLSFDETKEDIKNFIAQKQQKEKLDEILASAQKKIKVDDRSEQVLLKK